jgi:hypothetical protein
LATNLHFELWIYRVDPGRKRFLEHLALIRGNMSRVIGSLAASFLLFLLMAASASATPIVGGQFVTPSPLKDNVGGVFNSSLGGSEGGNTSHQFYRSGGISQGTGIGPHQFALRLPPPVESETPEPSTLTLFGTGMIMLAGAVRKRLVR